jgi:hypothetical protein
VARRRHKPKSLSDAELRVLEAFSCGRVSAGNLSAELARARRQRSLPQPIVLRQPAEESVLSRAA